MKYNRRSGAEIPTDTCLKIDANGFDCNTLRKIEVGDEDAARQISGRDRVGEYNHKAIWQREQLCAAMMALVDTACRGRYLN